MKSKGCRPRESQWILAGSVAAILLCILPCPLAAQTCLPYSQFMALTQPSNMEVKFTYIGIQEEPIETLFFASQGTNLGAFIFCRQPDVFYGNERLGVRSFGATSQQMTNFLELAGQIPAIRYGFGLRGQYLSFAMFSPASGGIGYEVDLGSADAGSLLNAARVAFADDPIGLRTINELGCDIDLPEPGTPSDVTADFAIKFSTFILDIQTGFYVGTVTVSNDSGHSIPGPVSLVVNVSPDVPLFNADGYTCQVTAIGRPFVSLPLTQGVIQPAETIQVTLQLVSPDGEPPLPTAQILAGPGAR